MKGTTWMVLVLSALVTVPVQAQRKDDPCPASRDCAGVRAAVRDYVEGFYEGDTAKLVRSVARDVHKDGWQSPPR